MLVCLDETSKQLIAETRVPIPMKPGQAARIDYEYERNGTANLFMGVRHRTALVSSSYRYKFHQPLWSDT